jgi:hypothetical protein
MNIPLGTPFVIGKTLVPEIAVKDISDFMDAKRTGYFCITTKGRSGVEEALLVLEGGMVVGAHYEYLQYGMEFTAGEALKRAANSLLTSYGVYDAFELSTQQLELLKIFNEHILLLESVPVRAFEGSVPVKFMQDYEDNVVAQATAGADRGDILKQHGLTDIKVDNYDQLKRQVARGAAKPDLANKVAAEMATYLGGTAEPTEEPRVEEAEMSGEFKASLESFDVDAEKLKKLRGAK